MGSLVVAVVLVGLSLNAAAVKKSSPALLKKAEKTEENTFMCSVNHAVHRINLDKPLVFCSRFNESNSTRNEGKCAWRKDCNLYDDKEAATKLGVDRLTNNTLIPRGARIRPKAGVVQFYCCKEVCRYANCMRERAEKMRPHLLDPKDAGSHGFIIKASFSMEDAKQPVQFESCKALCPSGGVPPPGGDAGTIPLILVLCPNECEAADSPKPAKCKCGKNSGCASEVCVDGFCSPGTECAGDPITCPVGTLTCGAAIPDTGTQYCRCGLPGIQVPPAYAAEACCSGTADTNGFCLAVTSCSNDVQCLPGKCLCTGKCDTPPPPSPEGDK